MRRESTPPTASRRGASASREFGMTTRVPTSAITPRATLRAKNEDQSKNSRRMPEPKSPMTAPPPATPTQTPTAWARSAGGNDVVMTESVTGITAAAPRPITARTAMRTPGSSTRRPTAAAPAKSRIPAASTGRRPNRSPTAPSSSSIPANTSVYASTIHCTSVAVAPVCRWRSGRATLRPLTAETTIIRARATTPRIARRRRGPSASAAVRVEDAEAVEEGGWHADSSVQRMFNKLFCTR